MIVFIDVNLREIQIYSEKGMQKVPFHSPELLKEIIQNQKVQYITNVIETNCAEIIKLIQNISGQAIPETNQELAIQPDLDEIVEVQKYIHPTTKGSILVLDVNVHFKGINDFKIYDDEMKEKVKKSLMFSNLIKNNKLEIVNEFEKKHIIEQYNIFLEQNKRHQKEAEESILVTKPVQDYVDGLSNYDQDNDIIEIEVEASSVRRRGDSGAYGGFLGDNAGAVTMSELQSMIGGN